MTTISASRERAGFTLWDGLAALLVLAVVVTLAEASRGLLSPLPEAADSGIRLERSVLPLYAARTTLRMLAAMLLSLVFTFTYATWAARSRRAEQLLIPLLDILQSVPILGFVSVTVVFFLSLAPGRTLGAELAAVFAIFTSQAWNMAFSFYQSLRTVPEDLVETARSLRLDPWMRFWRLDVPFAMPALVWNAMMSMSGGWFFVVASEAISVGDTRVALPGIGSYIALAIERKDLGAIGWAIAAMAIVILLYDQLLFRPLVAWAERFRSDQEASAPLAAPRSWVLTTLRRSRLVALAVAPAAATWRASLRGIARTRRGDRPPRRRSERRERWLDRLWQLVLAGGTGWAIWQVASFVLSHLTLAEAGRAVLLALATALRVFVLIAVASLVWVPIGVWVGLRPAAARIVQPAAQLLAAFPANLLFPLTVSAIVAGDLDPDVWLSPLMILGTQWYILFNVIAGASSLPGELRDIGANLHVRGWLWWRRIALPAVFPFYVTGAITASGGSWNASIVAEYVTWGERTLQARGIGAYIAEATAAGDFPRIALGIAVMSSFVVLCNRVLWRPLYRYAERRHRLG